MRSERPKGKGRQVKLYVQAETPPSSQDGSSQDAELDELEAEHMALLKRAKIRNLQLANAALREGLARGGYVALDRVLAEGINMVPRVASPPSTNDYNVTDNRVAPGGSAPHVEAADDQEAARDDEESKDEVGGNEEASNEDIGGAPLEDHLAPLNDHIAVVASPLAASDTGTDEEETKQDDSKEDVAEDDVEQDQDEQAATEQRVEGDEAERDDAGKDSDGTEVAPLGTGAAHPIDSPRATSDQDTDEGDKINQQDPDGEASGQGESDEEDSRVSPQRHRKRSPSPTSSSSPRPKRPRSTPSSSDDNQDDGSLSSDAEDGETSSGVDVASPELRRGLPLVDAVRPNSMADDDNAPAPYDDEPDVFDFGGGDFDVDEAPLSADVDMIANHEVANEPRDMFLSPPSATLATPATLRRLHEALRTLDARRDTYLASRPRRGRGHETDISKHLIDVVVQRGSDIATDHVAVDADMLELLDALAATPLDVAISRFMAIADVLQRRQWLRHDDFGEYFRTTVQNGTRYRGDRRAVDGDTGPWVAHPLQPVWSRLPTAIFPWWTARVHPSDPEPQSTGPSNAFMAGDEQVVFFPVDGLTGRVIFNALARPSRSSNAETRATSVELFRLTPNDADANAVLALAPYWEAAIQLERAAHHRDDPCCVVPLPEVFDVLEQAIDTWVANAQARRRPRAADLSITEQLDLVQALVPSEPLDRLDLTYMGRRDGCSFVTRARSVRWLVFDVCAVLGCSASRLHKRRCTTHSRDNLTECVVDQCDELGYGDERMCTRHRARPIPVDDD
ncbi:hypothetical protein SDRG_00811 [Saprolegnia diclina VS20]|uniref:Uncharacterized protein n=1 Tax=Saprolegnia diclina (strain VS20) TaxID=1156394 RepID=T0SGF2_SAPDV|nr:hypothetical protein SDRG_00811 [Saprolegnia diclina VS20]EQC41962.1 hypothetical protein SDRG_00811 [Saprolegnia diclina VS20]|eukprot:XP_008604531.1 hypothetical protein SDRG_00811 [Saprolegnia diclina VS20]